MVSTKDNLPFKQSLKPRLWGSKLVGRIKTGLQTRSEASRFRGAASGLQTKVLRSRKNSRKINQFRLTLVQGSIFKHISGRESTKALFRNSPRLLAAQYTNHKKRAKLPLSKLCTHQNVTVLPFLLFGILQSRDRLLYGPGLSGLLYTVLLFNCGIRKHWSK